MTLTKPHTFTARKDGYEASGYHDEAARKRAGKNRRTNGKAK